jgi:hypothetical protein
MNAYFIIGFMTFQACAIGGNIPFMISRGYEWWVILPSVMATTLSLINVVLYAKMAK